MVDGSNEPPRNFFAPLKAVYLGSQISEEDEVSAIIEQDEAPVIVKDYRGFFVSVVLVGEGISCPGIFDVMPVMLLGSPGYPFAVGLSHHCCIYMSR